MELFGVIGMIFVQGSTILQIVKFFKSKQTHGVSIGFWWVIVAGLLCYEVYAIHIKDLIYITSNAVGIILSGISISLYYYYRRKK